MAKRPDTCVKQFKRIGRPGHPTTILKEPLASLPSDSVIGRKIWRYSSSFDGGWEIQFFLVSQ